MLPEPQLRRAIKDLPLRTLHGPWSRAVPFHLLRHPPRGNPQPLWSTSGSAQRGYRFNPPSSFGVHYLALDPVTALAEVSHLLRLPDGSTVIGSRAPWAVVTIEGVLTAMLDVTDLSVQRQIGTNLQELTGSWRLAQELGGESPTQMLGRVLHDAGSIIGIRYPSARNPGGGCIAVFADRLAHGAASHLEVIDSNGDLRQHLPE